MSAAINNLAKDVIQDVLTSAVTQPFPASRKVYVHGVPMREITQSATHTSKGEEPNPVVTVYDTSGPYTDPAARIDLERGLPALREQWIEARGDSEQMKGPTSIFG